MDTFQLPEDLTGADLGALEAQAIEAFNALTANEGELTDAELYAQLAELERLAGAVQTLRETRTARVEAARKVLTVPPPAPEPEPVAVVEEPPTTDQQEEEPIVASGPVITETSVRGIAKRPVPVLQTSGYSITAAADVPGFPSGQKMESLRDAALALSARMNGYPRNKGTAPGMPDTYMQHGVAVLTRPENSFSDDNRDLSVEDLIEAAAKETRLPGGSLVAAGGWCAPSTTLYDLCATETLDGLIDLPEVTVTRGGIRFTKGPSFADIYASAGFCQTEAQAIAGTAKPCVEVACPQFEEVRLDVCGICVKAPILTNVGYPELVQRWIEGTLVAREHKESAQVIAKMVALAGSAQVVTGGAGTGFDLLAALEWSATSQKYAWRMSMAASLEVVAPFWAKPLIRADLALRQGTDINAITDAAITSHFAQRGVRVQWVYDWQPLTTGAADTACLATAPATFDVLVYPAGTFVKGVQDVITLDSVYDSVNTAQNMYTAVFSESGYLVANRCYDACLLTIPVCLSGLTGGALDGCLPIGDAAVTP